MEVPRNSLWMGVAALAALLAVACGHGNASSSAAASATAAAAAAAPEKSSQGAAGAPVIGPEDQAPPASQTGGFDGQKAYEFTAKQVSFGPRPPASDAIHRTQDYMLGDAEGLWMRTWIRMIFMRRRQWAISR